LKTIYSDSHRAHHIELELSGGALVPCFELPVRADDVLAHVRSTDLGPVIAPHDHGRAPLTAVHAPDYVAFLEHAWTDWVAAGNTGDAFSGCTPMADMGTRVPTSIQGRLGLLLVRYERTDHGRHVAGGVRRRAMRADCCRPDRPR
jgi:acetoin utilization deacetylase AcuC-like enzyme